MRESLLNMPSSASSEAVTTGQMPLQSAAKFPDIGKGTRKDGKVFNRNEFGNS